MLVPSLGWCHSSWLSFLQCVCPGCMQRGERDGGDVWLSSRTQRCFVRSDDVTQPLSEQQVRPDQTGHRVQVLCAFCGAPLLQQSYIKTVNNKSPGGIIFNDSMFELFRVFRCCWQKSRAEFTTKQLRSLWLWKHSYLFWHVYLIKCFKNCCNKLQ